LIGSVSGSGALVVALAALATAVVLVMAGAAVSLRRSARELQALAGELSEHASVVLGDAEETISRARGELARVDDLVGSAEAITETVGSASRLAHTALAVPLIKVMAFGAGTARAGKRIRKAG
jgi:hypothetical protein